MDSRHQPPPLRHPLLPRPPGEVPAAGYGLPASKPPSLQQLPSLIPIKENVGKEKVIIMVIMVIMLIMVIMAIMGIMWIMVIMVILVIMVIMMIMVIMVIIW